jgi:hypothetical protein
VYNQSMKEVPFDRTAAFRNFKTVMKRLIAVPKSELDEQVRLHDEQSRLNPSCLGPKPKAARHKA